MAEEKASSTTEKRMVSRSGCDDTVCITVAISLRNDSKQFETQYRYFRVQPDWVESLDSSGFVLAVILDGWVGEGTPQNVEKLNQALDKLPAAEAALVRKLCAVPKTTHGILDKEQAIAVVAEHLFDTMLYKRDDTGKSDHTDENEWSLGYMQKKLDSSNELQRQRNIIQAQCEDKAKNEVDDMLRTMSLEEFEAQCKKEDVHITKFDGGKPIFDVDKSKESLTKCHFYKYWHSEANKKVLSKLNMTEEYKMIRETAACKALAVDEARRMMETRPGEFMKAYQAAKPDVFFAPRWVTPDQAFASQDPEADKKKSEVFVTLDVCYVDMT